MAQPNPPGDIPLVEGLGTEWNDIVSAIPEEMRAELAPKLKERVSNYSELESWRDLHKSGITPDHAGKALNILSIIENNPQQVYETIGKSLGITPAQAEKVVEAVEDGDQDDPRIKAMQEKLDTVVNILFTERQAKTHASQVEAAEKEIDNEINALKTKYGNVDEREVMMRMMHLDMTAEEAYADYTGRDAEIMKRRPSPFVLGAGGHIPTNRSIDPVKLDRKETKNLVAQMLDHANHERKQ